MNDTKIIKNIECIVKEGDLSTLTKRKIFEQIQEKFPDCDFSDKKKFIYSTVKRIALSYHEKSDQYTAQNNESFSDNDEDYVENEKQKPKRRKVSKSIKKKQKNGKKTILRGFQIPQFLSPEMIKFCGRDKVSRTEVVKILHQYFKDNNLKDSNDGRKINCDKTLIDLLGVEKMTIFSMNKHISKHFIRSTIEPKKKISNVTKKSGRGIKDIQKLSKELESVVGKSHLSRSQVVKSL